MKTKEENMIVMEKKVSKRHQVEVVSIPLIFLEVREMMMKSKKKKKEKIWKFLSMFLWKTFTMEENWKSCLPKKQFVLIVEGQGQKIQTILRNVINVKVEECILKPFKWHLDLFSKYNSSVQNVEAKDKS